VALSSYCSLLAVVEIERGVLLDMIIGHSQKLQFSMQG
jgi:hypothetical protein